MECLSCEGGQLRITNSLVYGASVFKYLVIISVLPLSYQRIKLKNYIVHVAM